MGLRGRRRRALRAERTLACDSRPWRNFSKRKRTNGICIFVGAVMREFAMRRESCLYSISVEEEKRPFLIIDI
jgi:hypothetical protein